MDAEKIARVKRKNVANLGLIRLAKLCELMDEVPATDREWTLDYLNLHYRPTAPARPSDKGVVGA